MPIDPPYDVLGTQPISENAPFGDDATYDPSYEMIEAEIRKLEALSGDPPDWGSVVDAATEILGQKSKDITIATYLSRALFERSGYAGLAAGVTVLDDLCAYWDSAYPPLKRKRKRIAALSWFSEKLPPRLTAKPPTAADREAVFDALRRFKNLSGRLDADLEDEAPSLRDILKFLESAEASLAPKSPPPPPLPPPPDAQAPAAATNGAAPALAQAAPGPAVPAPPAQPAGDVSAPEEAAKAERALQEQLRALARYRRSRAPGDPLAYDMTRLAAWLRVDGPPPATDGVTQLPPPAETVRAEIDAARGTGRHGDVIEACEQALSKSIYWLDLNRFAAEALEALGQAPAAARIGAATAALCKRVPALPGLAFSGGMPFADPETQAWIETLEAQTGGAVQGGGPSATAEIDAVLTEALTLAKKDLPGAMVLLDTGRAAAPDARTRTLWQVAQCRVLMAAGRFKSAMRAYEHLDDEAAAFGLERWEPGLCAEIAEGLINCYGKIKGLSEDPAVVQRRARLEALLAIHRPAAAVKFLD